MNLRNILFILSVWIPFATSCTVDPSPICVVHTTNSILNNKEAYQAAKVGNRKRHATCTGATWFHENYLATLNLYGKKITTYSFDESVQRFTLIQEITCEDVPLSHQPEALAVSPEGTLLAVINNGLGAAHLLIFRIRSQTHFIDQTPISCMKLDDFLHNVRFTPDGAHVAYASFNNKSAVVVFKIKSDGTLNQKAVYVHQNQHPHLKAKGIHFTRDGSYAVIAYALSVSTTEHMPLQSMVEVYTFDTRKGTLGSLVSSVTGTFSFEDLTFLHNDHIIALPDQAGDQLILYPFDPGTGQVSKDYTAIQNPEALLSFPHGVATSPDGKYLVATNYGTDTFNLYTVN